MQTIFAQSSRFGKAGVAIFRISGPDSLSILRKLLDDQLCSIEPRKIYYKKLYDPRNLELIDNAMVSYFKAPASFTGEDIVELYVHGSIAIAKMLTNVLMSTNMSRMAEAGEFAKRAFMNGKFDLTAAEGLADLIEAETIMQHRQASRQTNGALEKLYDKWRSELLTTISLLEAYIDFPDEDIPDSVLTSVLGTVESLKHTISDHLNDKRRGERLRSGINMVIVGKPNVGKSSLLNFLMQREVAIVSEIEGTTRDVIEGHLDIGGYPIILRDTAGIRSNSTDVIEQEGIRRTIEAANVADIKILMFDANSDLDLTSITIDDNTILVCNKIDIAQLEQDNIEGRHIIQISVKENIGLDTLLQEIENLAEKIAAPSETPAITRERHRYQLELSLKYLEEFNLEKDLVLATEDIRMVIRTLSGVTGRITVDEILGEIFSNFCIGK